MLPSDAVETDLDESDEAVDGDETDRSRRGQAPNARLGVTLGEGELALRDGEAGMLTDRREALLSISAMFCGMWRGTMCDQTLALSVIGVEVCQRCC